MNFNSRNWDGEYTEIRNLIVYKIRTTDRTDKFYGTLKSRKKRSNNGIFGSFARMCDVQASEEEGSPHLVDAELSVGQLSTTEKSS